MLLKSDRQTCLKQPITGQKNYVRRQVAALYRQIHYNVLKWMCGIIQIWHALGDDSRYYYERMSAKVIAKADIFFSESWYYLLSPSNASHIYFIIANASESKK